MVEMKERHAQWAVAQQEAIETIEHHLAEGQPHEQAFKQLARWCLTTDLNPYAFMPCDWELSINSAQGTARFLDELHHAMLDDGQVCFTTSEQGPCMEFCHPEDLPLLPLKRRGYRLQAWTAAEFIEAVEAYERAARKIEADLAARQQQVFGKWA